MDELLPSNIYQQNLKILAARFPEVYDILGRDNCDLGFKTKRFTTRLGYSNLLCCFGDGREIPLHREEDIITATENLMDDWELEAFDFLICHGLGLGYIPQTAVKKFRKRPRIVIIENQPKILDFALRSLNLRTLLEYERLSLFVGIDLNAYDIINSLKEYISFGSTRLINHPAYAAIWGQPHRAFNQKLQSAIGRVLDFWHTSKTFGKQMISNTVENLPSLLCGTSLEVLKGKFAGIPAVCVAAGPSLDKSLSQLKDIGNRALILSGDSAVSALIRHKIIPHMVVTVDQHKINIEKIRSVLEHLREPVLVFGVESNPDNVRTFLSPRRIGITAESKIFNSWISPRWNMESALPAMNSISVAAIHIAHTLGCEPIVLVGMDLAYSGNSSHSKEAANHYIPDRNKMMLLEGVKGFPVPSLPQLAGDKGQIEQAIATGKYHIIDTSVDGAFIRGSLIKTIDEVVNVQLRSDIDVDAILSSFDWSSNIPLPEIVDELKLIIGKLSECKIAGREGKIKSKKALQVVRAGDKIPIDDIKDLNGYLDRFQKKFNLLIQLLEGARLDNVQDLYRKREQIEAQRRFRGLEENITSELEIIEGFFQSLIETVIFFEDLIERKLNYFNKTLEIVEGPSEPLEKHLHLARHYTAVGELWQADEAFRKCLKIDSQNAVVWQGVIELYTAYGLWHTARSQLEEAAGYFPQAPWLIAYEEKIITGIQALLDEAQYNLEHKNLAVGRLRVAEYLLYYPDDRKAHNLKREITRQQLIIQGNDAVDESKVEIEHRELLSAKKKFFLSGEYERVIGVLEGLIEDDPLNAAHYRQEIGYCRRYQGDHPSAAWNFDQARQLRTLTQESIKK